MTLGNLDVVKWIQLEMCKLDYQEKEKRGSVLAGDQEDWWNSWGLQAWREGCGFLTVKAKNEDMKMLDNRLENMEFLWGKGERSSVNSRQGGLEKCGGVGEKLAGRTGVLHLLIVKYKCGVLHCIG